MGKILCPSIDCADVEYLRDEIVSLDKAGADIFHCDISDGTIISRFAMGMKDFQCVRRNTDKLVDVHLFISNPFRYIELFAEEGADIIYVFPESEPFIAKSLYKIRELGKSPGLAIGYGTSIEMLSDILPIVDYVMVNTANPVSKQRVFTETSWNKLDRLIKIKRDIPFKLLVDGAITPEIIKKTWAMGVDGFVMGTGCLFHKKEDYSTLFEQIRDL